MKSSSTYKLLFLINILTKSAQTKKQIAKIFEENNIKIAKSSITNYINKLIKNGINITTKTNGGNEKIYYLEKNNSYINLNKKELNAISDIKKLLIAQKDYNKIRKTMRLFYRIACFIKDEETKLNFIDFGYYSTINWRLVETLEKHCKSKDIITIDYIMPNGTNKLITLHVDDITISEWSERLYLQGVFKYSKQFSHLPIDRIYMVKKIERKNVRFNLTTDIITYIVDSNAHKEIEVDLNEKIIKIKNNLAYIQRPINDKFYILQRLFYLCPHLYYISDSDIKTLLKEKLEKVKKLYEN